MTKLSKSVDALLKEFGEALNKGIESIHHAASIYVKAIDADRENKEIFAERFKDCIPASAWSGFEAVGRNMLHPKLLMGAGGRYANLIKRLPMSVQENIFSGKTFPMLIENGEHLMVDVRNVMPQQAKQMFCEDHVRTLPEQRAYLELKRSSEITIDKTVALPYEIVGGSVRFRANTVLNIKELRNVMRELTCALKRIKKS